MAAAAAGLDKLVSMLDEATAQPDVERTTDMIKSGLCRLIRSQEVELPASFCETVPDHYARRLLYRDPQCSYSVVVMAWAPGQATPVHDHAGMWCVEGVWDGHIEVQQYELVAQQDDRYRFEKRNSYHAGIASAGCLIPPFEYHRIANTDPRETAISIHIYGGEMTRCNVFERVQGDWYRRHEHRLGLD